jgi:hypothetical protein
MATTQHAITNSDVLDAVRRLVADTDRRSHDRRAAAVMHSIAVQKTTNAAQGRATDPDDNWLVLLSAIDRGNL